LVFYCMRILIYGINFSPELTGIGKYTGEMAAWLAARGHQVRVVTAPPYYPDWQVWAGFSGWRYQVAEEAGGSLRVVRCPLWVPARPAGLTRLLHLASFALSSLPVLLGQWRWRPEVVFVVEPPLFCAPGALLLARLCGAKAWLHIQDFEVDAAFDLGLLSGARLQRMVLAGERWLLRRFDRVSTISRRMLALAQAKGVAAECLVLFPNWVDVLAIQPEGSKIGAGETAPHAFRAELQIEPTALVALYSGNMGKKQGLEILAEAATRLRDAAGLVFVFCGNGVGRADLVARCAGLPNVRFLDLQPLARLGELLTMADIHLLPQRADAADLVMPSKLTGMLASGRPVVATAQVDTELANAVAGCGVVTPPGDAAAFSAAIAALAQEAPLRVRLGAAARDYAMHHLGRDAVLGQIEVELQQSAG
jgi:colanic acid biosynthesis glycosyl transferase WcaI